MTGFCVPLVRWVWGEAALVSSATLLRAFHEASRHCPTDGAWQQVTREPTEVVCHNDFAPYNLVFREGMAVAVIDSPGLTGWWPPTGRTSPTTR